MSTPPHIVPGVEHLGADPRTFAGYRKHRRHRPAGSVIVLLNASEAGLDTDGGEWVALCHTHGEAINLPLRVSAESWIKQPGNFCSGCQEAERQRLAALYPADGEGIPSRLW